MFAAFGPKIVFHRGISLYCLYKYFLFSLFEALDGACLKTLSQDPFSSVMRFLLWLETHTCSQRADGETQTTCTLPSSEAHSWRWDRPSIPHTNVSAQLSEQGKSQWGIKWGETSWANTGNSWTRTELWNFSPLRRTRCHYRRFMNGAQCHCRPSVTGS